MTIDDSFRDDKRNEFQIAFEVLLKLEDKLIERNVPRQRYELLLNAANSKIRYRKDIERVLAIIEELCDLL